MRVTQEEIENRTANLAISVTKLTARALISAYLKHRQHAKVRKEKVSARKQAARDAPPRGRQTVRELIGQNQGVSSMEIGKTDLKGFEVVARKYGVDYAIRKDQSGEKPRYIVFFKARDADALSAAFKEYMASVMRKDHEKKPSVLKQLHKFIEIAKSVPQKVRKREQERDL